MQAQLPGGDHGHTWNKYGHSGSHIYLICSHEDHDSELGQAESRASGTQGSLLHQATNSASNTRSRWHQSSIEEHRGSTQGHAGSLTGGRHGSQQEQDRDSSSQFESGPRGSQGTSGSSKHREPSHSGEQ